MTTPVEIVREVSTLGIKSAPLMDAINSVEAGQELKTTVTEMIEFLRRGMAENNAIGLSGVQIHAPVRIFVMKVKEVERVCIDPVIKYAGSDLTSYREGCVSFPGEYVTTKRYKKVFVQYYDETFTKVECWLTGLESICFQHELDHLNGIVMFMRQSKLKRAMWLKKQAKVRTAETRWV